MDAVSSPGKLVRPGGDGLAFQPGDAQPPLALLGHLGFRGVIRLVGGLVILVVGIFVLLQIVRGGLCNVLVVLPRGDDRLELLVCLMRRGDRVRRVVEGELKEDLAGDVALLLLARLPLRLEFVPFGLEELRSATWTIVRPQPTHPPAGQSLRPGRSLRGECRTRPGSLCQTGRGPSRCTPTEALRRPADQRSRSIRD